MVENHPSHDGKELSSSLIIFQQPIMLALFVLVSFGCVAYVLYCAIPDSAATPSSATMRDQKKKAE